MNKLYAFFLLCFMLLSTEAISQNNEPEFEMKQYYFVFLNAAPDRKPIVDTAAAMKIQEGHIAHIEQMSKDGKCKLAGPFMDKGETRGILILDVATMEEAEELCSKDPAVINGWLKPAIRPWYGPANLKVEPK